MGIFSNLFKKRNSKNIEQKVDVKDIVPTPSLIEQKESIVKPHEPVLQYEHNTKKLAPPKTFTDESGQRWIAKYHYTDVNIKKTSDFQEFFPYDYLDITLNEKGGSIFSFFGNEIGTLNKTQKSEMIKDFLSRDEHVKAQVQDVGEKILLRLFFYKRREDVIVHQDPIIATLTGNSNDDMQCNIEACSEGDPISLDYDFDKDKFLVDSNGYEVGYVPKSKHDQIYDLDNEGYEFSGRILSIIEKDSGKLSIKVEIIAH